MPKIRITTTFLVPGEITHYAEPSGPGVRVDGGAYAGWTVPIDYDPLLAKLTVWAGDREMAIARMRRALAEYRVLGITTNLRLFDAVMGDPDFIAGRLHTGFLDQLKQREKPAAEDNGHVLAAVLAAVARPGRSSEHSCSKAGTVCELLACIGQRGCYSVEAAGGGRRRGIYARVPEVK